MDFRNLGHRVRPDEDPCVDTYLDTDWFDQAYAGRAKVYHNLYLNERVFLRLASDLPVGSTGCFTGTVSADSRRSRNGWTSGRTWEDHPGSTDQYCAEVNRYAAERVKHVGHFKIYVYLVKSQFRPLHVLKQKYIIAR